MKSVAQKEKNNTREVILHTIKSLNEATVEELAEAAGVSPVTVRHHLNSLLAEDLILTKTVRRKVGRPHFVYVLSPEGQELFPQKYFRLSNRLLDEMKKRFAPDILATLLSSVAQELMAERSGQFKHLAFEGKLNYLVKLLNEEGFLAEWEKTEFGYQIIEHNCPYFSIGESHHEICTFDKDLIIGVLHTPEVEQHSCMLKGDNCCQFTIPLSAVH